MRSTLISVAFAALAVAAPSQLSPRAKAINDGTILNYALTLEHLEDTFYREALQKFDQAAFAAAGYDAKFYKNIKVVSSDEKTHVQFITQGLKAAGVKPVKACTYDFGLTDVDSFVALASVLEGVGVSAYLGAAASIMSDDYLTAAGSILTVEARHSSYLRDGLDEVPFAQPFDNPLSFNEVYTLASQFIKKCPPSNPKLPFKPFPALTAANANGGATITNGDKIKLSAKGINHYNSEKIYGAFITVLGPTFVKATKVNGHYVVKVPKGIAGQSYVVLNGGNKKVSDDTVVAGPAIVEITA